MSDTSEWLVLPGGRRLCHASFLLTNPRNGATTLALLGGAYWKSNRSDISLVCLLQVLPNDAGRRWRKGPSYNISRNWWCDALKCNKYVYLIGGRNQDYSSCSDSIKRIQVSDLLDETSNAEWEILPVRLSHGRFDCSAVTVHDRFIVVMGGLISYPRASSSVEIIDTIPVLQTRTSELQPQQQQNFSAVTIAPEPPMFAARAEFGAEVMGKKIWAVGGWNRYARDLNSIEYLEFNSLDAETNGVASVFSSNWNMHETLSLGTPRSHHAVTKVGQCLVVAGGFNNLVVPGGFNNHLTVHVEVIDPNLQVVWRMPDIMKGRVNTPMVYIPDSGLLLLDDASGTSDVEFLPLVELSPAALLVSPPTIPIKSNVRSSGEEENHRQQIIDQSQRRRSSEVHKLRMTLLYHMVYENVHQLCLAPLLEGKRMTPDEH